MSSDSDMPPVATSRFFPGLGKFLMWVLGFVVLIAPVITLIAAKSVRQFARQHPYYFYTLFIIAVTIIISLCYAIYYLLCKNKALRQSEKSLRVSLPTDGDRAMSKKIVNAIPPEGDLMRWLKLDFDAASLPADSVRNLRQAGETLGLSPVDFSDEVAHDKYTVCISALDQFTTTVTKWTKTDARGELKLPNQWDRKSEYEAAKSAIQDTRTRLIESYDALIGACHRFQADT